MNIHYSPFQAESPQAAVDLQKNNQCGQEHWVVIQFYKANTYK